MGHMDRERAQQAHHQVYGGGQQQHGGGITHELLAGAAGFEAMRMYEHHREREGITEHHELGKELIAGFAVAEIDKHFEKGGLGHLDRGQAQRGAAEQALGLFEHHRW